MVSKNRFSGAKTCISDDIFYNLADNFDAGEMKGGEDGKDLTVSGHCIYNQVHDGYENFRKISILDDGFSALNIKKDLNIVLIDGTVDLFTQNVIPAGILREPVSSLKYADAVVVTKSCKDKNALLENKVRTFNKNCPVFYSHFRPLRLIGGVGGNNYLSLKDVNKDGRRVVALSAIGNPGYFYNNLTSAGVKIDDYIEFEDHHGYSERDMETIKKIIGDGNVYILTTLKDYVKLAGFSKTGNGDILEKIYYLDFEPVVDEGFFDFILLSYGEYLKNRNEEAYNSIMGK